MLLCMHEVGSLVLANLAGILACLDGYMNIAMEQTEEYVNGQLKNKYGDAFIRGNNVLYISTSKRTLAEGA
uniref:Sm domain-containing protein n=1 Tax=Glycine max TaxID=3847 RepID=A0A0R0IDP7_SOYBN